VKEEWRRLFAGDDAASRAVYEQAVRAMTEEQLHIWFDRDRREVVAVSVAGSYPDTAIVIDYRDGRRVQPPVAKRRTYAGYTHGRETAYSLGFLIAMWLAEE